MTDHALIVALFNLVGAAIERLTGETILLCVEDEAGNIMHLYPDTSKLTFGRDCPVHAWPNGIRQAPLSCYACMGLAALGVPAVAVTQGGCVNNPPFYATL